MIAVRFAEREAVERPEARHVGARDHRAADEVWLVAGELAPERRLEIGVLAHGDRAGIGQRGGTGSGSAVERFEIPFAHEHGQVMVAEADRALAECIARCEHIGPLGQRFLVGRAKAAKGKVDPFPRCLPLVRGEALTDDHLARQTQQRIEQAGTGRVGIILEA
jgi:hypothetical protein